MAQISAKKNCLSFAALRLSSQVVVEGKGWLSKSERMEGRECITSGQEIFIKVILDGVGAHNEVNLGVVLGVVHDDG